MPLHCDKIFDNYFYTVVHFIQIYQKSMIDGWRDESPVCDTSDCVLCAHSRCPSWAVSLRKDERDSEALRSRGTALFPVSWSKRHTASVGKQLGNLVGFIVAVFKFSNALFPTSGEETGEAFVVAC